MTTVIFGLPWSIDAVGGVNEVVRGLLRSACAAGDGVRPSLLVSDYGAREPSLGAASASAAGVVDCVTTRIVDPFTTRYGPRARAAAAAQWIPNVLRLAALLRRSAPAAVNVHYPGLWCITLAASLRLVDPRPRLVLSFHGSDVASIEGAPALERAWWRMLVARADAVTCCSHALRERLHAALGIAPSASIAIPNGLDVKYVDAAVGQAESPAGLERGRYVVNVATFEHKKGQDVLLHAFARLHAAHPGLRLAMLGRDGPARAGLEVLARELGLADAVTFVVDAPHGAALAAIRDARVFVLSSRREPFGIVLLEAAHFGVPIVATGVDGVLEVVRGADEGLLVPPDDPEALAVALDRVLRDDSLASRLGQRAHSVLAERFGAENTYRRYRDVLLGTTALPR